MLKSAVIYARVSTKEQREEGFSIPAQISLLNQYASRNHFQVLEVFSDEETARKTGRPEYKKMLTLLKREKSKKVDRCRTILVEKTDRLYRNFRDYVDLDDLDVEIHLVKEGEVLSRDSRSHVKFIHGIKVLMAKNYSDNLAEEASKGMAEKASQGHWPSCAPIGYINNPTTRLIEPDPFSAPLIVKAFNWYASGNFSLQQVADRLEQEGLRSKRVNAPLDKWAVQKILQNPLYYGEFNWKKRLYKGHHIPLISKDLYHRVQQCFAGKARPKKRRHEFLFSGLIRCAHCGCMVTGMIIGDRYIYYHCTGYKAKCPERHIRQEVLDQQFAEILKALEVRQWMVDWIQECLEASHHEEVDYHTQQINRLRAEYDRLQNRIDKLYLDKLDGIIEENYWEEKNKEFLAEQSKIHDKLKSHQVADSKYKEKGVSILKLSQMAYALYQKQTQEEKRRLLQILVSKSVLRDGKIVVELRQPFEMIKDMNLELGTEKAPDLVDSGALLKWRGRRDLNSLPPA